MTRKVIVSKLKEFTTIFADKVASVYVDGDMGHYFGKSGYALKVELVSKTIYCLGVYQSINYANHIAAKLAKFIASDESDEFVVPEDDKEM